MALVLGIDIGSTASKVAVLEVDDSPREIAIAAAPTPHTADDLVAVVQALVHRVVQNLAADLHDVEAIGVASMAETGAPVDADGHALTPLLRWNRQADRRELDALMHRHPGLAGHTGVPATTKPMAVTLAQLRIEEPDAFGRLARWFGAADLVAHALTGEYATDHTLAGRSMLTSFETPWEWDAELVSDLDLPDAALPGIVRPGEPAGHTDARARDFGVPAGIPVYIAGHDHAVGAWAAGVRRPGEVADSLGTAEAIVRVTDGVDVSRATACGYSVGRSVDGAQITLVGGSPACGAMLTWWSEHRGAPGLFETLTHLDATRWDTTSSSVLPYPSGRQCPRPDPAATVVAHPINRGGAEPRAVLEGLILHAAWVRRSAAILAGSPDREVVVLGSLARRIPVWAPLAAALTDAHTRAATVGEPVASGAALLAASRAGLIADTATLERRTVSPAEAPGIQDAYQRFVSLASSKGRM